MKPPLTTNYQLLTTKSPLVVIVGETASGKSAVAMDIARAFDGEVVAADSWTVYRGFDIGTAKPSLADRAQIRHHMIDIVDAPDGFNASLFKDLAVEAIENIHSRGKIPILVGGTGLYIDSVLYDYSFLPPGPASQRAKYNLMSLDDVLAEVSNRKIDLSGIDTGNKRRIIRLLETDGQRPVKAKLRPNSLILGIKTSVEQLQPRIQSRTTAMLLAGLADEAKNLAQRYGWEVEPMKGIGYAEWQEFFGNRKTLQETTDQIVRNSMNLAKRQRTWFRRNNSIHWLDDPSTAVDMVTTFLNKKQ